MTISLKVAVVGSHRVRVAKVLSLLKGQASSPNTSTNTSSNTIKSTGIHELQLQSEFTSIEYIGCVATFDSYQDQDGKVQKYLAKLEYHDKDCTVAKGSSLAPFFDEYDASLSTQNDEIKHDEKDDVGAIHLPGIAAFVIGCGIESNDDVEKIQSFIETMTNGCALYTLDTYSTSPSYQRNSSSKNDSVSPSILVQCVQPNDEYQTMTEENQVYKNMTLEEKEQATALQTIGPGKMVKFVTFISHLIVSHHCRDGDSSTSDQGQPSSQYQEYINEDNVSTIPQSQSTPSSSTPAPTPTAPTYHDDSLDDPTIIRYACKMCRTKLFAQCHLEDPPHPIGKHGFSSRKQKGRGGGGSGGADPCHSYFLASSLDWMGDVSSVEGKLSCPKCNAKLGLYNWTGSQCSCGSWITPAIQIQKGRVDEIRPFPTLHQPFHQSM